MCLVLFQNSYAFLKQESYDVAYASLELTK